MKETNEPESLESFESFERPPLADCGRLTRILAASRLDQVIAAIKRDLRHDLRVAGGVDEEG